jgi:spermidine synthase
MAEFGERLADGFFNRFEGELLYSQSSPFQKIDVWQNPHFGRVLTLDDLVQTTERDEFTYHEMLVHPALCSLATVGRVLIIGGGDGGTLRHVLMHSPDDVVMCEIDETVVRVCREYMPGLSDGAFDDPRARVLFADGAEFAAQHDGAFDAIIVDGSDAVGPAAVLFSEEFYSSCRRALAPGGVFVTQSGSPLFQTDEFRMAVGNLSTVFATVEPYLSFVPTYPGAVWSYVAATDGSSVSAVAVADVAARLDARGISARLYTPDVHAGSFALPAFVHELVETSAPASVPGS